MAAAQAEAQGRTAGTTAATPMVPTTPQYNAENNLPPGMTQMPVGSAINLSRATVPAGYRRDASEYGADTRAGAPEYGADSRAKSAADVAALRSKSNSELADAKQQFEAYQNQLRLNYQDRWQAARNAVASNTQNSFYNRQLLRQFDSNEQQHAKLLDQTYKEQQKQLEAGALLDQARGVTDGGEFTDPWSGKKMTMNYAQRLRLQNGLNASQAQVADLKNRAGQIEQRFGVNSVVIPPLGSPAGGSAAGPSTAPSSPVAQPSAAGGSAIPTPQAPRPVPTVNAPPQQRPDYCGSGGRRASGEDREPGAGECLRAEERHHARRCASGIQGRSLHGPIGGRHPHTRRVHGGGGQPRAVRWRSESRFVHGVPSGAR